MWMYLYPWEWRGESIVSVFTRRYERRWHKRSRKFRLEPTIECQLEDLTPYEVGQLLGGN